MKLKSFIQIVSWDMINPMLLKFKKNKKYPISKEFNGINIGCGISNPENWIGVDGGFTHYLIHVLPKPLYKIFFKSQRMSSNYTFEEYYRLSKKIKLIHHELLFGLPFENDSVPNVFSSHFFEHLFYKDAEFLMKECYRVLKPNGIVRICVPSLVHQVESIENAIKNYRETDGDDIQNYVTTNIVGFNSTYSNHRYMYDAKRMTALFAKAGFKNIKEYQFKEGEIPDVEILDTRTGIFVEARK